MFLPNNSSVLNLDRFIIYSAKSLRFKARSVLSPEICWFVVRHIVVQRGELLVGCGIIKAVRTVCIWRIFFPSIIGQYQSLSVLQGCKYMRYTWAFGSWFTHWVPQHTELFTYGSTVVFYWHTYTPDKAFLVITGNSVLNVIFSHQYTGCSLRSGILVS